MNTLEEVLSEWQNNIHFKEEFKKNPQAALTKAKLTLSDVDLKKISVMLHLDDELLEKRINK